MKTGRFGSDRSKPLAGGRLCVLLLVAALLFPLCESSALPMTGPDREPPELSGPPKKYTPPSAVQKEFANAIDLDSWKQSDPMKAKEARDRLTAFLDRHRDFAPAYMMRAMGDFCVAGSKNYDSITDDLQAALRTRTAQDEGIVDEPSLLSLRGKVRLYEARYKDALDDLESAMKRNLDDAGKIFGSGAVEPQKSNSNACEWTLGDFSILAERFPRDYRVPLLRGLYISFFTTFDEKFYSSALQQFREASLLNFRSPLPPFFIGELYSKAAFWSKAAWSSDERRNESRRKAIEFCTKAIQLDPKLREAYAIRASAYQGLKQYAKAIPDYDKVLELDSENITAYADRGLANLEMGRYMAATVDLGEAISRNTNDNLTLSNEYEYRGDAYAKLGMYRDSIASYTQAIKCQLASLTHLISLKQFRALYPEYDNVPDNVLITKINLLFWPQYDHGTMTKVLTEKKSEWAISMINEVYEKRGDMYLKSGDFRNGVQDFNRIFKGIPAFADAIERWRPLDASAGSEWFIDVRTANFGATPRLWAKFVERNGSYSVQSFEFDCKGLRFAPTSTALYTKGGELVRGSEAEGDWQRAVPQTRGEQMLTGMCGN